jgi:dienelactone hydrolase
MRSAGKQVPDEAIRRYKTAYDYGRKLPRANGRVATVGICAGGSYTFRFAGEVPEIDAAVVFYGTQPTEEVMVRIKAPVLGFYGQDDARVTATVELSAMKRPGEALRAASIFARHTWVSRIPEPGWQPVRRCGFLGENDRFPKSAPKVA